MPSPAPNPTRPPRVVRDASPDALGRFDRRRSRRRRTWLLALGLGVLALAVLAVAAVLAGAWYAEDKARTKLAELGARAGLQLGVGAVVLEPGSNVEVRDLVVTDPDGDVVLARIGRVVTDLTLGALRDGQRMPGRVVLDGLDVDFTDLERWKRALERYRGRPKVQAEGPVKNTLPSLAFAGATFHIPDPISGVPLSLTEVDVRLEPPGRDGEARARLAFRGLLEGKHRIVLDALLDPQNLRSEGGFTFNPPLEVALGELGAKVRVGSVYAKQNERFRARDLAITLPGPDEKGETVVTVGSVEVSSPLEGTHTFFGRPLRVEVNDVAARDTSGRFKDVVGTAAHVTVDFGSGSLNQLPARLQKVVVENAAGELGAWLVGSTVHRIELVTDGVDLNAPLAKLTSLVVMGADLAAVMPASGAGLSSNPLYRKLEALLAPTAAPGGPNQDPPPRRPAGRRGAGKPRRAGPDAVPTAAPEGLEDEALPPAPDSVGTAAGETVGPPLPVGKVSQAADAAARSIHTRLRGLFGDRDPPLLVLKESALTVLGRAPNCDPALDKGCDPFTPAFELQRFSAGLTTDPESGALVGTVTGRFYEPTPGAAGTPTPDPDDGAFLVEGRIARGGGFDRAKVKFKGRKLAGQLTRVWDSFRVSENSAVDFDLTITPNATGRGVTLSGTGGVRDLGFFAPRIHGSPVDGLQVESDLTASYDFDSDTLSLEVPRLVIADQLNLRVAATLERVRATFFGAPTADGAAGEPAEPSRRRRPRLDFKVEMPRQDCDHIIAAIPKVMAPRLDGLVLDGTAEGHIHVSVDLEQPRTYEQDLDIDMRSCRPTEFGNADVPRLNSGFVQEVVEKGLPIGVTVGPGTWHYRTLDRIPKYVQLGALWTEDHSFYQHAGFRPPLIRRAVIMNLEGGRYVYGGSTITQQLVKNLFLSREKTLTRKLEEAIIVWLVERTLTKDRILELYLNCIEYGPSIYGIENAARAYFGRHVEELEPLEMAFLMGLKPYPWAGWDQFERGFVKPWWHRRISKILIGMERTGWISAEQLAAAQAAGWEPTFLTSAHRPRVAPRSEPPAGGDDELPVMPNDLGDEPAPRPGARPRAEPVEDDEPPPRDPRGLFDTDDR